MARFNTFNKVIKTVFTGTINKGGKSIILEVATETSRYKRPGWMVAKMGPRLQQFLEERLDQIKPGTQKIILRNAEHESPLDPRPHYSLICIDENQNRETIHVTVEGVDAQTGEATVEEDKGQETK